MRWLPLVLLAGCTNYAQHRAALVPHAEPVQTTGQPQDTIAAIGVAAPTLADIIAPTAGTEPAAGIAVPSHQLRGSLTFAPTNNLSFGLISEQARRDGAHAISSTIPPLPDNNATGVGFSLAYSIPTSVPGFRIGLATELLFWDLPWIAYTSDTSSGTTFVDEGSSNVPTFAAALTPSYRQGQWIGFGGVTLRNHPTIDEKAYMAGYYENPEVKSGPLNATLAAGVGFVEQGVQIAVDLHQTITADPVRYGPAIGLSVSFGIGQRAHKPPSQPVVVLVPAPQPQIMMHREAAWTLTQRAAAAARAGDCETVRRLGPQVWQLDNDFFVAVFARDVAIARCLAEPPPPAN